MTDTLDAIDVENSPDLARLVDELRTTGSPRVLRREGVDVALLMPIEPARDYPWREPTEEDWAAFRAAAGSWKGLIDVEKFLRDNYESRRRSSRPPVDL